MGNKLRGIFMPHLKWLDKSIIDANPCNTCPIHEEYMEKAMYGSVAERQYAEPPDSCPCYKKLLWKGECLSKLEWYESQDKRLHPELEEKSEQPWISVKDRLPELTDPATPVLLATKNGTQYVGFYFKGITTNELDGFYSNCVKVNATHWMPLPEPPKEDCHGETANSKM